ncbi:GAF domain-containing protein [bacterium]|nr:GAF domain-containing protein [bacterium]
MEKESILLLNLVGKFFANSSDISKGAKVIFQILRELVDYDYATIFYYDRETDSLKHLAYEGQYINLVDDVSFGVGDGIAGWVAQKNHPILLSNIKRTKNKEIHSLHSFMSIPLRLNGRLVGVLNIGHTKPNALTVKDLDTVNNVMESISGLLMRMCNQATLERKVKRLEVLNSFLKENQKELLKRGRERMYKAIGNLVARNISNPLTLIVGNAEFLMRRLPDKDKETRKKLADIIEAGDKIVELTETLINRQAKRSDFYPNGLKDGKQRSIN